MRAFILAGGKGSRTLDPSQPKVLTQITEMNLLDLQIYELASINEITEISHPKYFEVNEFVSDAEVSWTTHMVAFNKELTLRNLSDKIINSTMPIDYIINYFTHICKCLNDERRMVCYIPNEIICKQLSYRDDENKPEANQTAGTKIPRPA
jgi:hypothetical protein